MLPETTQKHIEENLNLSITDAKSVAGGSINRAARVETDRLGTCFLKWNRSDDPDMFKKEVAGLKLLRSADCELVIPEAYGQDTDEEGTGYLLMDFLEKGSGRPDSDEHFGRELAHMHQEQNDKHGLDHDNYIGRLPQSNTPHESWVEFFINERIDFMAQQAIDSGAISRSVAANFENMYKKLPDIMPEEPPSLLHGDLWGGNYFYTKEGTAAIFDPAVYYGSREMELAFTHMFGGFSSGFYNAYNQTYPLEAGFNDRIQLYNLYHLLTHTNMFGGHYARQVERIVKRF